MNKEFIPYEQALKLKELGFDEPCFCYWYTQQGSFPSIRTKDIQFNGWKNYPDSNTVAPLYQQAFRWFREKHGLMGSVCEDVDGNFSLWTNKGNLLLQGKEYKEYKTYEEAELACLKKLIEIVKNK
jgi:hypothetical protein